MDAASCQIPGKKPDCTNASLPVCRPQLPFSYPYGTVLIMSPWNYPLLLTLEPLIDAIAAGNTVILKPSAYAPASLAMIKEIIETTFPADYISVIEGGRTENQALLRQKFDKIFFTGSKAVGKEVLRHAAENLTPVTLELVEKVLVSLTPPQKSHLLPDVLFLENF